jgi:hypothetical protein
MSFEHINFGGGRMERFVCTATALSDNTHGDRDILDAVLFLVEFLVVVSSSLFGAGRHNDGTLLSVAGHSPVPWSFPTESHLLSYRYCSWIWPEWQEFAQAR